MNPILTLPAALGAASLGAAALGAAALGAAALCAALEPVLEQAPKIRAMAVSRPPVLLSMSLSLYGGDRWGIGRLGSGRLGARRRRVARQRGSSIQPAPPTISDTIRCWFARVGTSSPTLRPRRRTTARSAMSMTWSRACEMTITA